ncbi:MAG: glycerophosphodiester phosphodiesterase family protein [Clostridia bacterium]
MDKKIPCHNFAHRGLHNKLCPENSLSAFKAAICKGYGIELDVQMLSSGEIVVFHDDTTMRLTGKNSKIENLTKDDLKEYFLNHTKETIPLLSEVLSLVKGKVPLLIEIKNFEKVGKLEQALGDELSSYKGCVLIQSFNPFSLKYFAKHFPKYPRGQLASHFESESMSFFKKFLLKNLLCDFLSKPDFISYDKTHLNSRCLKNYKKPVFTWTIRNKEEEKEALKKCTHIIFENYEPSVYSEKCKYKSN